MQCSVLKEETVALEELEGLVRKEENTGRFSDRSLVLEGLSVERHLGNGANAVHSRAVAE